MEDTLSFQLIICFGIICLFVVYPWVRRIASVGLPLCYVLSLAIIHWLGALIHALPVSWHSGPDPYTRLGFNQAFWATVAFSVGSVLIAPYILKLTKRGEIQPVMPTPRPDQLRLPMAYLLLGIVFFGLLAPALK